MQAALPTDGAGSLLRCLPIVAVAFAIIGKVMWDWASGKRPETMGDGTTSDVGWFDSDGTAAGCHDGGGDCGDGH